MSNSSNVIYKCISVAILTISNNITTILVGFIPSLVMVVKNTETFFLNSFDCFFFVYDLQTTICKPVIENASFQCETFE
jgi:hypothetical protein